MIPKSYFTFFICTGILAGCGGGGTSDSGFDFLSSGALTVAELNAAGNALANFGTDIGDGSTVPLSEADLIAQGSASYSGYMLGDVQGDATVIVGRANLDATFTGGGSVTGSVTDMVLLDGDLRDVVTLEDFDDVAALVYTDIPAGTPLFDVPGALTLFGGNLTTNDGNGSLSIDVSGTATVEEAISITGNEEIYDVDGTIESSVTSDGTLAGVGELMAESNDAGFDLDVLLFAR